MYFSTVSAHEARWRVHPVEGGLCIDGCTGTPETIHVPPAIGGVPVVRLCLGADSLTPDCRSLIISEGIREAALDFSDARELRRLDFPSSARLTASPRGLDATRWFRSRRGGVYLGGYYCGTPGGGCGGDGELRIKEGTVAIAYAADFHCFWRSIVMPDSVKSIDQLAFGDARCLESLRLPAHVESIGDFAFQFCPRLGELYLPDSLRSATAPFLLCPALREVSMAEGCPIKTKFPHCTRLIYRSGGHSRVLRRGVIPIPVSGTLRAFPDSGSIIAAGRSYSGPAALTVSRLEGDLYADCFGNPVQRLSLERGGEEHIRWYTPGPTGLAEISHDALCRVYLVREGIGEGELPPELYMQLSKDLVPDCSGLFSMNDSK